MRKLKFYALLLAMVLSSSHTPRNEERIKELVAQEIKNMMFLPESYDPIKIQIDSAFFNIDNPELFSLYSSMVDKDAEYQGLESSIKEQKKQVDFWKGWDHQKEEKQTLQEMLTRRDSLDAEMNRLADRIKEIYNQPNTFHGYKVHHSFRAKDNDGRVSIENIYLIVKPEIDGCFYLISESDPVYIKTMTVRANVEKQLGIKR